jgi:hypothetical protein
MSKLMQPTVHLIFTAVLALAPTLLATPAQAADAPAIAASAVQPKANWYPKIGRAHV